MSHPDENVLVSLGGALRGDAGTVMEHLAGCPACRKRVEALGALAQAVGEEALFPVSEADALAQQVLNADRARRWSEAADRRISRVLIPALATLCAAILLWLGAHGSEAPPTLVIGISVAVGGAMAFRAGTTGLAAPR